jgi:hypothetical protein
MKNVLAENATRLIEAQKELIDLYRDQVVDLSMMSKIELGDDVIEEIKRLQNLIKEYEII